MSRFNGVWRVFFILPVLGGVPDAASNSQYPKVTGQMGQITCGDSQCVQMNLTEIWQKKNLTIAVLNAFCYTVPLEVQCKIQSTKASHRPREQEREVLSIIYVQSVSKGVCESTFEDTEVLNELCDIGRLMEYSYELNKFH